MESGGRKRARICVWRPEKPSRLGRREVKALSSAGGTRRVWPGGGSGGGRGSTRGEAVPTRRVPAAPVSVTRSQLGHQPVSLHPRAPKPSQESHAGVPPSLPLQPAPAGCPHACLSFPTCWVFKEGNTDRFPEKAISAGESWARVGLGGQPHHPHPWASPAAPPCGAAPQHRPTTA